MSEHQKEFAMKDFFRPYVFFGISALFLTFILTAVYFPEIPSIIRIFITMAVFSAVVFFVKYLEERK